mmetsp:Transcript_34736/g.52334  ORF Transcript_34736/g.52334 Transcript_34736/m.52334 type:complete len:140 (-) Transcript_34736:36-455(-)
MMGDAVTRCVVVTSPRPERDNCTGCCMCPSNASCSLSETRARAEVAKEEGDKAIKQKWQRTHSCKLTSTTTPSLPLDFTEPYASMAAGAAAAAKHCQALLSSSSATAAAGDYDNDDHKDNEGENLSQDAEDLRWRLGDQ